MAKKKHKTYAHRPRSRSVKNKPLIVTEPAGAYGSAIPDATGLTFEKVWLMHLETEKKFQETDKKFQETREQMKETDKKIRELAGLFTTQWGKLVEALLAPGCLKLFRDYGIDVTQTSANVISQRGGETMELDVFLANGFFSIEPHGEGMVRFREVKGLQVKKY